MDTTRESVDQSAIRLRLERAQDEIDRLSESRTNWRWSIPANPDRDSDLILSGSVRDVAALLAALAAERDRADRAEAERDEAFTAGLAQVARRAEDAEARADRAEARLAEAWDEGHAAPSDAGHWENDYPRKGMRTRVEDPTPNPYRPEATA